MELGYNLENISLYSFGSDEGASPSDDWKILSVKPAVNGYLFQIREG